MDDKIPAWVTPGATVFAWLPQMPHRYINQPTRWQCKVLSVQQRQSRHRPESVILSVPEEVYLNKSFSQYYPDFNGYVRHIDDQQKSIKAIPLKLYRNNTLQLEQTQPPPALSQPVISPSPTTSVIQNVPAVPEKVSDSMDWIIQAGHGILMSARRRYNPPASALLTANAENSIQVLADERCARMRNELAAVMGINAHSRQLKNLLKPQLFAMTHPTHSAQVPKVVMLHDNIRHS